MQKILERGQPRVKELPVCLYPPVNELEMAGCRDSRNDLHNSGLYVMVP